MNHIKVAAAVIIDNNKVFAAQRENKGELALFWEFPGGKLEDGESGESAIVREIEEELSIKVEVIKHLINVEHKYKTFSITLIAYLCKIVEGELTLKDHVNSEWLVKEQLYTVNWAAADLPIVKIVETMLGSNSEK
jgi:8-oxo-dGTP diphosphatase